MRRMLRPDSNHRKLAIVRGTDPVCEICAQERGSGSVFERLITLASRANYECFRDGAEAPADNQPRQELRREHQAVFERWLCLTLQDKLADLDVCAENRGLSVLEVIRPWMARGCRQNLIPAAACQPQQDLFELEFEILLPIVRAHSAEEKPRRQP
jgi:hypothetical protein